MFPLSLVAGILHQASYAMGWRHYRPSFDVGDFLLIIFTVLSIYIYLKLIDLLNRRYNLNELDLLIRISIWWAIIFQLVNFILTGMFIVFLPDIELGIPILMGVFFVLSMMFIGVVDIMIAVKLFRNKDKLSDLFIVFAYVSVIAGICEITVILTPVTLILVPVSFVVLGMIFLHEKTEMEFV